MKRFVVPPNWPVTPRRNWIPPKSWHPDASWPPAPPGWRFWVDGRGKPVLGPVGRYAAPSRRAVYAGAAALLVFAAVNIWAVLAIGVFNGSPDDSTAVKFAEATQASSPSQSPVRASSTPAVRRTTAPPLVPHTVVVPSKTPTHRTTSKSTRRRSPERAATTPIPTRTIARPRPSRSTVTPSTQQDLFRQYCIQQGIDPAWCDSTVWRRHP